MSRRSFVKKLSSAGAAATLATWTPGCEFADLENTDVREEIPFSIAEGSGLERLQEVGNIAPLDDGALQLVLVRDAEDSVLAFNRICTHLEEEISPDVEPLTGTPNQWIPEENALLCAHHFSKFNAQGEVISGPAASALAAYRVEFDPAEGTGTIFTREAL